MLGVGCRISPSGGHRADPAPRERPFILDTPNEEEGCGAEIRRLRELYGDREA